MSTPTGTVTFLFTDVMDSTRLWEQYPQQMPLALARHNAILREAIVRHNGYLYRTVGDAFHAAFDTAPEALLAALDAQRALQREFQVPGSKFQVDAEPLHLEPGTWNLELRVRMALHTGMTEERESDYVGPLLNRVARLVAAAHAGQVLLSLATQQLVRDSLPPGVTLRDLGEHRLKDLTSPERVFQLVVPDLPSDFPPLKTLENCPNNLPLQPTTLIGREQEVEAIRGKLLHEEVRLLTLTGMGGIGKTRLALQAAAEMLEEFPDGVYFVPLAVVSNPDLVATAIAQALGIPETTTRSVLDNLKDFLREKRLLLILDNFEQVLDAAPLVAELLTSAPNLEVIVTSRSSLRLRDEHEFPVPPLSLPPTSARSLGATRTGYLEPLAYPLPLEQLSQYEAVRLFVERATALKPDFQLTEENAQAVVEICHRLEGVPLAIELAAARIKILSPQAMLPRLQSRLKLLTGGGRDLPLRQQTLRGAIAWSHDLLNDDEKALFRRVAVFVGGCTLEAVGAVASVGVRDWGLGVSGSSLIPNPHPPTPINIDVLDGVSSLVDKNLLRQQEGVGDEPRFVMLETLREYGLEQLAGSGEEESVRQQHALFFLEFAESADPQLKGTGQALWLDRLEEEHDNLRAAMDWFLLRGEVECGLRLSGALWRFWYVRSYFTEGRKWLTSFLDLPGGRGTPEARAKALNGAGNLAYSQADYDAAQPLHEQSLALSRELGDQQGVASSLNNLGIIARRRGDYDRARAMLEEAIEINCALGNRHWQAINLNNLGNVIYDQGDYAAARAFQEQSLSLFITLGDEWGMGMSLNDLGKIVFDQGDYDAARAFYERSLDLQTRMGNKHGVASALLNMGVIAHNQSDYATARQLHEQSLQAFKDLGDRKGVAEALHNLGKGAYRQGDYDAAGRLFQESLAIRESLGDKREMAESRNNLGLVALAKGDYLTARTEMELSLDLWRELGNRSFIPTALNNLGLVALSQGEYDTACSYLQESLSEFEEVGDKLGVGFALLNLGLAVAGQGNYPDALGFYHQSITLFTELGDRLHVATCLIRLASLTAVLGQPERAVRLAGAGEAILHSLGVPLPSFEQPYYRPTIAAAQAQLGEEAFSREFAQGQAMSMSEATAYALGSSKFKLQGSK